MRFKKLKIAVGTSLVVFVLIASIIIVAGMLKTNSQSAIQDINQQSNALLPSNIGNNKPVQLLPDNMQTAVITSPSTASSGSSGSSGSRQNAVVSSPQPVQQVRQPVVVSHKTVTTRAS